jgi:hypothetical protein
MPFGAFGTHEMGEGVRLGDDCDGVNRDSSNPDQTGFTRRHSLIPHLSLFSNAGSSGVLKLRMLVRFPSPAPNVVLRVLNDRLCINDRLDCVTQVRRRDAREIVLGCPSDRCQSHFRVNGDILTRASETGRPGGAMSLRSLQEEGPNATGQ